MPTLIKPLLLVRLLLRVSRIAGICVRPTLLKSQLLLAGSLCACMIFTQTLMRMMTSQLWRRRCVKRGDTLAGLLLMTSLLHHPNNDQ